MIDWTRVTALRDEVGCEDFDEVVELFLQEVDEEIDTLKSLSSGPSLAEKLHFLKGSALNLGFEEFSALCHSGETSLASDPDASVDLARIHDSYLTSRSHFIAELPTRLAS